MKKILVLFIITLLLSGCPYYMGKRWHNYSDLQITSEPFQNKLFNSDQINA